MPLSSTCIIVICARAEGDFLQPHVLQSHPILAVFFESNTRGFDCFAIVSFSWQSSSRWRYFYVIPARRQRNRHRPIHALSPPHRTNSPSPLPEPPREPSPALPQALRVPPLAPHRSPPAPL